MNTRALGAALALSLGVFSSSSATPKRITVQAGEHDRQAAVVQFKLPQGNYVFPELRDGKRRIPLQVDKEGNATFILDTLAKGGSRTFDFVAKTPAKDRAAVAVRAKKLGDQYVFSVNDQPVVLYQMDPSPVPEGVPDHFRHGAHLHAFAPSGLQVTGDYPPDHYHHRGIWMSWTHTEFEGRTPDFWNMGKDKSGKLTGEIKFEKLNEKWSGVVHGGFVGQHRWFDHTGGSPRPVLNEMWEITIYDALKDALSGGRTAQVFDMVSTQNCATDEPLKLPEYFYGGLGYRGNRQWDDKSNFFVLTSEGETDRAKSDQNHCRWIALSGKVDGKLCGLAIFDNPSNFRFPQTVRVNPKNPQTCNSVSKTGAWEIVPGKPYVSRYRFVAFDGEPDAKSLERLWNDYAHPVEVTVK